MPFSSSSRGTRFGMSAWPAGICAARADPFTNDRNDRTSRLSETVGKIMTSLHSVNMSSETRAASAMLWTRLMANIEAMMFRLLNLSAR